MSRPVQFPPKLLRKPGTNHARTCYRNRYYTCGAWDTHANRASVEALKKWNELVQLWTKDPDAVPGGEHRLTTLLADWLASDDSPTHKDDRKWVPVLVDLFAAWRPDGIAADRYDGAAAEDWQEWLCKLIVDGKLRYNRTSIKRCLSMTRRAVKWAARRKTHGVTWEQYYELEEVPPPKPGRVREPVAVLPVAWDAVEAACAKLHPQLAVAVKVLWWAGARPTELLSLRVGTIQRSGTLSIPKVPAVKLGKVWAAHVKSKADRMGHVRCLMFGPRSQAELLTVLKGLKENDYLFAPKRSLSRAEGDRTSRSVGECYTKSALRRAVHRACDRAKIDRWHPSQLRHACSARVRGAMGEEAEQAALGHGGKAITDRYAGYDAGLAAKVALKLG